jgi:hypothetical protein
VFDVGPWRQHRHEPCSCRPGARLNVWRVRGLGAAGKCCTSDVRRGVTQLGCSGFPWHPYLKLVDPSLRVNLIVLYKYNVNIFMLIYVDDMISLHKVQQMHFLIIWATSLH